jgi:hypothetical protein
LRQGVPSRVSVRPSQAADPFGVAISQSMSVKRRWKNGATRATM